MEEERKPLTSEDKVKLVGVIGVFIAIFVYCVASGNNFGSKNVIDDDIKASPETIFSPVKDNYTLKIRKVTGSKEENIEYITDGTFKLYNVEGEQVGYLIYKGKTYQVQSKNYKIKEIKDYPSFINDRFANIDFIKVVTKHCENINVKNSSFDCNINLKDYIEEYNTYYHTHYEYTGEEKVIFTFEHGKIIRKISVDYSEINKIINNGKDLKYVINVEKVNDNDYSGLLEIFKDTLK